jgi:hypothetical protein
MDILGTFPTSSGGRIYDLAKLPPADYAVEAYAELVKEYASAFAALRETRDALSKASVELKKAEENFLKDAVEAQRQGKARKDPRPALRERVEQAGIDVAVAETACEEISSRIYNLRNDPRVQADWKTLADGLRADGLERATRQRDELEATLTEVGEIDFAVAWSNPKAKANRAFVLGSAELGRLEKLLSAHGDRRPIRFVSPDGMRRLQLGETVEAVDGVTLTPDEANALLKARKLRVRHGRPQPRSSTGFGDLA